MTLFFVTALFCLQTLEFPVIHMLFCKSQYTLGMNRLPTNDRK